ncbi:MAG: metal ABC transporter solute-binding protein, Zn/Mn family [Acidimicrobiales bacterium]
MSNHPFLLRGALAAVAAAGLVLTGCAEQSESGSAGDAPVEGAEIRSFTDESKVWVAAAFYPLAEAARAVGGDRVEVIDMTPVGASPHGIAITPKAAEQLERAEVFFFLGKGFQPPVEKAASALGGQTKVVDLLPTELLPVDAPVPGVEGEVDGEVLAGDVDPHVWVDPVIFSGMVDRITAALIEADPQIQAEVEANAAGYQKVLAEVDSEFREGLANCKSKVVVTSHRAFGYMTNRYGLRQLPIAGISPEEEPNPKSLAAVAIAAKAEGVTTVFFEELVPAKLAKTVADAIGAGTDALNPIEGLTAEELGDGRTYASIQRDNLASLVKGLGCGQG